MIVVKRLLITPLITIVISTLAFGIVLAKASTAPSLVKVFIAESGSLVRLRCDPPKDFWQHASPSNDITFSWRKSPKEVIFQDNEQVKRSRWKKNKGQSSIQEQRENLTPFSSSAEMEIKSAKASDSGLWTCSGSLEGQQQQIVDYARLIVIPRFASGPFLFQSGSGILSNSSVIIAREGEDLQLFCVARQASELEFDLNGREIRGHKVLTYLMGPQVRTSVAYKALERKVEKGWGNVSCGSTLVKIDVHFAPSFTIKREPQFGIPVLTGMTVMLGCEVDAHPATNATGWLKNEKQLETKGPILTLHDVDIKDVGWYQCTTSYYGESVSSIGYFLNIHPPLPEVENGSPLSDSQDDDSATPPLLRQQKNEDEMTKIEDQTFLHDPHENHKKEEQQKSAVEIATNVLQVASSEEAEKCGKKSNNYGHPQILFINGTSASVLENRNLSVRICANPPVDRIIWELPTSELLKPGQSSLKGLKQLRLQSWPTNATCSDVKLFAQTIMASGSHTVLAVNRWGYDQAKILVADLDDLIEDVNVSATFQQTNHQCDSVHFQSWKLVTVVMIICHFLA